MSSIVASQVNASAVREISLWRIFLVVYGTALAMLLADIADGVLFLGDVDDRLRELQIRYLMSPEGHWFDPSLPFISMPATYVSPWSRLVDLPYAAIGWLLQPFVGPSQALSVAFQVWPPMLLAVFCLLVASTVRRLAAGLLLSNTVFMLSLALMTMLMSMGVLEFSPGRIDHHNVQIVTLMAIFAGLVRWDRVGGLMIGAGSALSTVIGLECLPFVVVAYAGLVACYIAGVANVRSVIVSASIAMFVVTVLSASAFTGLAGALSTQCDAFSAPYIFLLCGFSCILAACALMQGESIRPVTRLIALALPALVLVAVAALLFPACLSGPYSVIDPISREFWFNRIWQEKSIRYFYENAQYNPIVLIGLILGFAILAVPYQLAKVKEGRYGPLVAYLMVLCALILTLLVTRNIRFPLALMPVFLPGVIGIWVSSPEFVRSHRVYTAAALAVAVLLGSAVFWISPVHRSFDAVDYMAGMDCAKQDLSVLESVPAGRIALPQGLALSVLRAAPAGFSVAAAPFHRASPGMKRMYEAFLTSDSNTRRQALAPFDYLAVCQYPVEDERNRQSLYVALARGGDWPGLMRVSSKTPSAFQLFRIDHTMLR